MIRQHRLGKEGEPRPPTGSGSRWKQGLEWEAACIGLVNGNGTAANGTFNRGPENRNLVAVEYFFWRLVSPYILLFSGPEHHV